MSRSKTEELAFLKKELLPEILSVVPPLMDFKCELLWLDGSEVVEKNILYGKTNYINSNIKNLMEHALIQPLSLNDQQILLDELAKYSELVFEIGITPLQLPQLVANNPLISFEILLRLVHTEEITEYFHILVNMDITFHSLEVVNRLTNSVNLPPEFLHLYISNCITTCEMVKDKYMQSRLVRLVCVFLQSLIRNKIVNVKELFIEIEAFCVEFSRIKEAVGLYRLLKHLEIGDPAPSSHIPTSLSKQEKQINNKK